MRACWILVGSSVALLQVLAGLCLADTPQLRSRLQGHTRAVWSVAFSPDGKTLASASHDGSIKLWDGASGNNTATLRGHTSGASTLTFSPDGKSLASAGGDKIIELWDLNSRTVAVTVETGHTDTIVSLAFSPSGKTLASGSQDNTTKLWDVASGKNTATFQGEKGKRGHVWSVAFSPDGKRLAAGSHDQTVRLWDLATGKERRVFQCPGCIPYRVRFSADGETLLATSFGQVIYAWSVDSGAERSRVQSKAGSSLAGAVSADGRNLAGQVVDGPVCVWELATGKERTRIAQKEWIWAMAFSPDGKRLIGASHSGPLRVWDLAEAREIGHLPGHATIARALDISSDGKILASAGDDGAVLLWDLGQLPKPGQPPPRALSRKELESEWQALGQEDAARAYQALWALCAVPGQVLPLLQRDLRPATAGDARRIATLVKNLDSRRFVIREKATAELEKMGAAAEAALRKTLDGNPSADLRQRVQKLLKSAGRATDERLRTLRRLELLERIGTSAARQVLRTLAENESDAWLAREAQAARVRLQQRAVKP